MPEIKMMYRYFGITHVNPVYQEELSTEKELYALGITNTEKVKRTTAERQIYCSQHILYAMLLRLYLNRMSFADFEQRMKGFFSDTIRYIIKKTEEYAHNRNKSLISRLIKHEHA